MIPQSSQDGVPVPEVVTKVAAGRPVRAVWRNEVGGLTYEIGAGNARQFLKWTPPSSGIDLPAEAARLCWARPFIVVPEVLDQGADPSGSWMLSAAIPGRSAVDARWKRDPETAVRAIGAGLRALHETLPVAECPFDWSVPPRLERVRARAAAGRIDPRDWHPDLQRFGPASRALDILADPPPVDRIVVGHGDACAPNTLIGDDGRWSGHVDLGRLGIADRWADLAIATWSTQWNYGPGWEEPLLEAYGVEADPERTAYYRLLWDLAD